MKNMENIVTIDRYKWLEMILLINEEVMGFSVKIKTLAYTTVVQDKLIQVYLSVTDVTGGENLTEEYEKYSNLFYLISHSIVLPEQYINK
jgi:hypothetical protein